MDRQQHFITLFVIEHYVIFYAFPPTTSMRSRTVDHTSPIRHNCVASRGHLKPHAPILPNIIAGLSLEVWNLSWRQNSIKFSRADRRVQM